MSEPTDEGTVLAVDDEKLFLDLYREWLGDEYAVRVAREGDEALGKLDGSVDVVLLDRRMSGRSGDAMLDTLRDRSVAPRVAFVTAVEPGLDILGLEFDAYVVKPTGRDTVTRLVGSLVELDDRDAPVREYHRARAKRRALRKHVPESELASSRGYAELVDRLESLAERVDDHGTGERIGHFPWVADAREGSDER